MITAFPKVFAIGTDYIRDLFNGYVEITEKVDGSQFVFGRINETLYMRSKGAQLFTEKPEKMFLEAIHYIDSIQEYLPEDMIFYCEYLKNPKHNTLKYNRIPKNHLMLFGVKDTTERFYVNLSHYAEMLDIECVPVLSFGSVGGVNELMGYLDSESFLGGTAIEGIVVKNYDKKFFLGGQPIPLMAGKLVSERFKEVHRERWGKEEKTKSRIDTFMESFRTEARWEKAVQHLRDSGELGNEPRDIGKLFKIVHQDIDDEEKENIKNFLWGEYGDQIKRRATAGMPEWYKNKLAERAFD